MVDGIAKTPRFVLKEALQAAGPKLARVNSITQPTVIYGFSSKPEFDRFIANCERSLMPYPLIKGFLQNRIDANGDPLQLIVIDVGSEAQEVLYAAEFESVLHAIQHKLNTVPYSHSLSLNPSTSEYCISAIDKELSGTPNAAVGSDVSSDLYENR